MFFSNPITKWQLAACLVTFAFLLSNYVTGVLTQPTPDMLRVQVRDIGAAMALPIVGGYALFVLPVIIAKARQAIFDAARLTGSSTEVAHNYAAKISALPRQFAVPAGLMGSIIMIAYFYTEGLFYVKSLGFDGNLIRFPLALQTIYMWSSISFGICIIYRITRLTTEFVEHHLKVEAFRADEIFPIANTVFWNALYFSFGLALVPLFWLGAFPSLKDMLLLMTVLLILFNLMFYPLLRVRQIVIEKKAKALQQFRQQRFASSSRNANNSDSADESFASFQPQPGTYPPGNSYLINMELLLRFLCLLLVPLICWAFLSMLRWLYLQSGMLVY